MKRYKHGKEKVILAVKGMAMGAADIVPGVSGGTIALISGIYEHLISAISKIKLTHGFDLLILIFLFWSPKHRKPALERLKEIPWEFLIPLALGIIFSILMMSRIIGTLLGDYPFYMYSFFFGLIAFSLTIPFRHMHKHFPDFAVLVAFALLAWFIASRQGSFEPGDNLVFLFFAGAVAISAMILPGISGAYILVLLGEYQFVLNALHERDFVVIGVFIAGMATGLLSFVRLLKYILYHWHSRTMAALTGVMAGSMIKLWPIPYLQRDPVASDFMIFAAIAFGGVLVLYLLEKVARWVGDPEPPV